MKITITYRSKKPGISMRVNKDGDVNISASYGISKADINDFIERHRDWIEKARTRMAESQSNRDDFFGKLPLDTAAQCDEATRRLNSIIPPLVHKYEEMMGVRANGFSYRRSRTRWGSCNVRTHHINISAYVLLLPEWCIEHVVVHELAHIIVPNHSEKFYAVMDRYFPRWKEARAETRRISKMGDEDAM